MLACLMSGIKKKNTDLCLKNHTETKKKNTKKYNLKSEIRKP